MSRRVVWWVAAGALVIGALGAWSMVRQQDRQLMAARKARCDALTWQYNDPNFPLGKYVPTKGCP